MKIVLWGATGLTGREVLYQALEGGHEVKAVARNPGLIEAEHANLSVVRGDALNPQSVQEALAGGEVVISTIWTWQKNKVSGSLFTVSRHPPPVS